MAVLAKPAKPAVGNVAWTETRPVGQVQCRVSVCYGAPPLGGVWMDGTRARTCEQTLAGACSAQRDEHFGLQSLPGFVHHQRAVAQQRLQPRPAADGKGAEDDAGTLQQLRFQLLPSRPAPHGTPQPPIYHRPRITTARAKLQGARAGPSARVPS